MKRRNGRPRGGCLLLSALLLSALPTVGVFADENTYSHVHIDLTDQEIRWLEEHPRIRIAGPSNFPPFHMYDELGESQGIASDYALLLLRSLGVEVETLVLPWPRVLEMAEKGELDLISCAARSSDRERFLLFTEPHLSFPLVIICRRDEGFVSGLQDIESKSLALVKGNIVNDWIREKGIHPGFECFVDSPLEGLEAVSQGKADLYIGNLASCAYYINKKGLLNLKVAAPTEFGNYDLYIAVRKDWPELISILNKGLGSIAPEQHSRIRDSWISLRYEYGLRPSDILRYVLLTVVVALIVVGIILRWNRLLAREVEVRKEKERELKRAMEEITNLEGLLPICSRCKNIRDDKGYWNKIEAYFEEHSDLLFSHGLCPDCARELYKEELGVDPADLDPEDLK